MLCPIACYFEVVLPLIRVNLVGLLGCCISVSSFTVIDAMMPKRVIEPSVSYLLPAVTKTCNPGLAEAMLDDDELDFSDGEGEGEGAMSKRTLTWTVTAVRLGHTHAHTLAKDAQRAIVQKLSIHGMVWNDASSNACNLRQLN